MYTDYFPPSRLNPGRAWFVAKLSSDRSGLSWSNARNSLQNAIDLMAIGDTVYVAPGQYDESLVIPAGLSQISVIGVGPSGSVEFAPSAAGSSVLINNADNVLIQNITFTCPDTDSTVALTNTGSGLRCTGCRMRGGDIQVLFGPGVVTAINAVFPTAGAGLDGVFFDCEISEGTNGFVLQGTDYGPASKVLVDQCRFLRLTDATFEEQNLLGSAANQFRNLLVKSCTFEPAEDGTEPTGYILLNDSNSNTGMITNSRFTVALNSGKNLVSTKVIWVGNYHLAGLSTGQPS